MFTENEIAAMVEIPAIKEVVLKTRKDFIQKEAKYLEISEHDFLSLVMMTPTIGIALADGSIGFLEEISLNKKARRMSKGGFVLSKDPVSDAMRFLIKNFKDWELTFYNLIQLCMTETFSMEEVNNKIKESEYTNDRFTLASMRVPHILVRFVSAIFIKGDSEIVGEKKVSKVEFTKINDIASKMNLATVPFIQMFLKTFKVK